MLRRSSINLSPVPPAGNNTTPACLSSHDHRSSYSRSLRARARVGEYGKGEGGRKARPPDPPLPERETAPSRGQAGWLGRLSLLPTPVVSPAALQLHPTAPRHTRTVVGVKPTVEHWHAFTGAGFLRSVQINILTFLAVLPTRRHEATPTRCPRGETGYRRKDQGPFFETPSPLPPHRKPRA